MKRRWILHGVAVDTTFLLIGTPAGEDAISAKHSKVKITNWNPNKWSLNW